MISEPINPDVLFSELRARFQQPQLDLKLATGYSKRARNAFDDLCEWFESTLQDPLALDAFTDQAEGYLDTELERRLGGMNRVLNQEIFIHNAMPLVERLMRGVHVIFHRETITKAYLKQLETRYKAMSDRSHLHTLNVDSIELRNAKNLFKVLEKYQCEQLKHFAFGIGELTGRKPGDVAEVMDIVFEHTPEHLEYLAIQSNFTSQPTASKILDACIQNLPRLTHLEEFVCAQWITDPAHLESLLDAIPESVKHLSISLYMDDCFSHVVEIFKGHSIMAQLEGLRIGYVSGEYAERLEALDEFKALDHYAFGWSYRRHGRSTPTCQPWHDVKEDIRQTVNKKKDGEDVALTAEQLNIASFFKQKMKPDALSALLLRGDGAHNVFPRLHKMSASEFPPESINLLFAHGGESFPVVKELSVSASMSKEELKLPESIFSTLYPWERLETLNLRSRGLASRAFMGNYLHALGTAPLEGALFPHVTMCMIEAHPDMLRGFFAFRTQHMPALKTLHVSHGVSDDEMCEAFEEAHRIKLWDDIPQLTFNLHQSLTSSYRKDADKFLIFWIAQVKDATIPTYIRRSIMRDLLSENATKPLLSGLFAREFGAKVKKSGKRQDMVDTLVKSLPSTLHDYKTNFELD